MIVKKYCLLRLNNSLVFTLLRNKNIFLFFSYRLKMYNDDLDRIVLSFLRHKKCLNYQFFGNETVIFCEFCFIWLPKNILYLWNSVKINSEKLTLLGKSFICCSLENKYSMKFIFVFYELYFIIIPIQIQLVQMM